MTCRRLGIRIPRPSPNGTEKHGIEKYRTRNIVVVVVVTAVLNEDDANSKIS